MTYPKVRIEATPIGNGTRVFIDGVEQTHLVAVELSLGVNKASILTLTHIAVDSVIEGEMHVLHARKCAVCGDVSEPIADVTTVDDEWEKFCPVFPK